MIEPNPLAHRPGAESPAVETDPALSDVDPPFVVKSDPFGDAARGFAAVGVALEVNVLILQRPPQPLDEDVVHPAAAAVHGDRDACFGERAGERSRGEL